MESEGSLPFSQQPAICAYPEPDQSSLRHSNRFIWIHSNIFLPTTPRPFKWSLSLFFHHIRVSPLRTEILPLEATSQMFCYLTFWCVSKLLSRMRK